MKTEHLSGKIELRDNGEYHDILLCGERIVAEWAEETLHGSQVSIRYWISNEEAPADEIKRAAAEAVMGRVDAKYEARYSEITGYLWTDEDFVVGGKRDWGGRLTQGHDMIKRLTSEAGKYLVLEADIQ